MALDALVDSTQLGNALGYTASRIRAKTGSSSLIPFDLEHGLGFGDAVDAIETGGGDALNLLKALVANTAQNIYNEDIVTVGRNGFAGHMLLTASLPNCTSIGESGFSGCSLTSVSLPKVVSTAKNSFRSNNLVGIVLPSVTSLGEDSFYYNANTFEYADFGNSEITQPLTFMLYVFEKLAKLSVVIIRHSAVARLTNLNVFSGTPFASGGTGGEIYIDDSFYQELGTGSSFDYKAATNWSVIDGYGTITWKNIKGSIYETQYADGTPIPTA